MTAEELRRSVAEDAAPAAALSPALRALWWAAKGAWDTAHEVAQAATDADAAWAHAWLHRQEGDQSNADYWYRRAGRSRSALSLQEEWNAIAASLLQHDMGAKGG